MCNNLFNKCSYIIPTINIAMAGLLSYRSLCYSGRYGNRSFNQVIFYSCLVLDEADRLLDMGYEKDVAAIVKAIEDHKLAATYDPMAMVKQTVVRKTFPEGDEAEVEQEKEPDIELKHNLTKVFTSKERQTILLSATLTKVSYCV